jgi:CRISPR/Cas system-associated endoribonuclease Cas2
MTQEISPKEADKALFSILKKKKIPFTVKIGRTDILRDITIYDFSMEKRKVVFSNLRKEEFKRINEIVFAGKSAVIFFEEVLPYLPKSSGLEKLEGRKIFIYPFAEKEPITGEFLRFYPYFFLIHREKEREINGKIKKFHSYIVKYKVFISAFSFIAPYPELKETDEFYGEVQPGTWREELKELNRMMRKLSTEKRFSLTTFILKDGKEITGKFNKNISLNMPYLVKLYSPSNQKSIIAIYKHAIEDFFTEE